MLADQSDEWDQVDHLKKKRRFRSNDELLMRDAVDAWGRARWPAARVVHELVMDRGNARADMAFVAPAHLVSVEIKSSFDVTDRLMMQVGTFRLATPETWVVINQRHQRDAELIRYLIPSIGMARAVREKEYSGPFTIEVVHEPAPFVPHPEALLSLMWAAELHREAVRARVWQGRIGTHAKMLRALLALSPAEQVAAVCRQLRARDALWRADPPVPEHGGPDA